MWKFTAHAPIPISLFTIDLENKKKRESIWKELGLYPVNSQILVTKASYLFTDTFAENRDLHIFSMLYFSGNKRKYCFH